LSRAEISTVASAFDLGRFKLGLLAARYQFHRPERTNLRYALSI
jgi:hypothetical protein